MVLMPARLPLLNLSSRVSAHHMSRPTQLSSLVLPASPPPPVSLPQHPSQSPLSRSSPLSPFLALRPPVPALAASSHPHPPPLSSPLPSPFPRSCSPPHLLRLATPVPPLHQPAQLSLSELPQQSQPVPPPHQSLPVAMPPQALARPLSPLSPSPTEQSRRPPAQLKSLLEVVLPAMALLLAAVSSPSSLLLSLCKR